MVITVARVPEAEEALLASAASGLSVGVAFHLWV